MFFSLLNSGEVVQGKEASALLIFIVAITLAVLLTFYVFRSIGIYTLAKRAGFKNAFLAWIPCAWVYTVCKLIGRDRILGKPAENVATLMVTLFTVVEVITVLYNVLYYFPVCMYVLQGGTVYFSESNIITPDLITPYSVGVKYFINILGILSDIGQLANIFVTVTIYFGLFRKYWPEHYILASLLSIFLDLFGIFVFVIRKKEPTDYLSYVRSRYNVNPNNQYNPYGQNEKKKEEPFSEFGNKKEEDPFPEFSDKDKK